MKPKPKILCLMQLPPPVHGVAMMNSFIKNSQVLQNKFQFDILALQYSVSTSQLRKASLKKLFLFFKYYLMLFWKLIFNRPNLVYFTLAPFGISFFRDALMVLLIKLFKIKLVFHLHGKGIINYYNKQKLVYDYVFKNVDVICLAECLKKDIPFFKGVPFVLNNGIPKINYKIKEKDSESDQRIRILYLSNFVKSKGVLDLINACELLKNRNLDFSVYLIGQFRDELPWEKLQAYIQSNYLEDRVELIGPVFGTDKYEYFQNSDIFVFPTYYENETFGLVLLEAMQFGLPCISTFEGGIPEVIEDNVTGILFEKRDYYSLADKLEYLIRNKSIRRSMGEKGKRRFYNRFTLKIFENNLIEILLEIIAS